MIISPGLRDGDRSTYTYYHVLTMRGVVPYWQHHVVFEEKIAVENQGIVAYFVMESICIYS